MDGYGRPREGVTQADLEKVVGVKVDAKVLFYLHGDRLFFKMGNRWYEGAAERSSDRDDSSA